MPFGGLNVILLGDFHQLPPVASNGQELYNCTPSSHESQLGQNLFEQFDLVIQLQEQMRVRDPVWNGILQRSRTGDCTRDDIAEIHKLVLTNPECNIPDFTKPPWNEVILVTLRNSVRSIWNDTMLRCHCKRTGQIRYILYAHDKCASKNQPLTRQQRLTIAHLKLEQTNRLPNKVEFAIGMKVMVLENIAPDADLANGSQGIISDIILDFRESAEQTEDHTIRLQYPPAVILFTACSEQKPKINGLPAGTIPIFPLRKKFKLGGKSGITIEREQFALTPAYAFTDYKSQGQTIEHVVVDIAKPPSGSLTPFDAYVALSRSQGRDTIRLLREFDDKLFTTHPNELLRSEDVRLAMLEKCTLD